MRTFVSVGLLLAFSMDAYAQRRGFGGQPPGLGRPATVNPMPPAHLRPSPPPGGGAGRIPLESRGSGQDVVVPYFVPYPVYSGGGSYPDTGEAAAASEADTPYTPTLQQSPPPGIVEQYYPAARQVAPPENQANRSTAPTCRDSGERSDYPVQFFIALKNSWVYTAVAYWVQGETLHYISSLGGHNMVSLDLVDREVSAKLNAGRRVEFVLPQR